MCFDPTLSRICITVTEIHKVNGNLFTSSLLVAPSSSLMETWTSPGSQTEAVGGIPSDKSQVRGDGSSLALILKFMLCCELQTSVCSGCWDTSGLNHWQLLHCPSAAGLQLALGTRLRAKGHRILPSTGIMGKLDLPVWSNSGDFTWLCLENKFF